MQCLEAIKNPVTLMGESAGSQSVCIHIVSSLPTGLFHTSILQSGPRNSLTYLRDESLAHSTANDLASLVGCTVDNWVRRLDCLRAIQSNKLVAAMTNVSISPSTSLVFKDLEKVGRTSPCSLIVDGVEISVHPLQAFLSGNFNQISDLISANHDEFVLRGLYERFTSPISVEDYLTRVLPIITYNHSEIQALFDPSQLNDNCTQACVALFSQHAFICTTRRMAGYMSGQPTYLYTYNRIPEASWFLPPDLILRLGAYHGAELFSLSQALSGSFYGDSIF